LLPCSDEEEKPYFDAQIRCRAAKYRPGTIADRGEIKP
jgi:hypothetical protein